MRCGRVRHRIDDRDKPLYGLAEMELIIIILIFLFLLVLGPVLFFKGLRRRKESKLENEALRSSIPAKVNDGKDFSRQGTEGMGQIVIGLILMAIVAVACYEIYEFGRALNSLFGGDHYSFG